MPTCITLKLVKRFLLSKMKKQKTKTLYLVRVISKATGKIECVLTHEYYLNAVKDNEFYNSTENLKSDIVILK